jgi:hypothetical protein
MEKIISGKGYFPVLMLSTHLMEGKLEIPDYQREADAWSNDDKSNLFYSILTGFPIGEFIRNEFSIKANSIATKFHLLDGQQRLTTLTSFISGKLKLTHDCSFDIISKLSDDFEEASNYNEKIAKLYERYLEVKNNKSKVKLELEYDLLPKSLQDNIKEHNISVVTFKNASEETCKEYFNLVQSGKRLTTSDKVHTVDNELMDNIKQVANNNKFIDIFNNTDAIDVKFNNKTRDNVSSILEVIANVVYGRNLGQPDGLDNWVRKWPQENIGYQHNRYFDILRTFFNNYDFVIPNGFRGHTKTVLKTSLPLVIYGLNRLSKNKNFDLTHFGNFVFDITSNAPKIVDFDIKPKSDTHIRKVFNPKLLDLFLKNKEMFMGFARLKSGSHSSVDVRRVSDNLIDLYEANYMN